MGTEVPPRDTRTTQFLAAAAAIGILLAVHLVSYVIACQTSAFGSGSYVLWACVLLPLMTLAVALALALQGKWHWGQLVLVMLAALLFSFLHLLLCGIMSASV
jgi:hypothetical protein